MKSKNLGILSIIVIICILIVTIAIVINQPEETQIQVLSNSSLYNGENITIQLTTTNGTPLTNEKVNITIINENGGKNVQNLITDNEGKASVTLGGVTVGKYSIECSFGGSDDYKQSNCTSTLEIKEEVKQNIPQETSYNKNYNYRPEVDSSGVTREEADYYGYSYTSAHGGHYIGTNDHWDPNAGCYHD